MRNNPYNKSLKDPMPLFMQGPSSVSALIFNEEQKNFVEKAKQPPNPKMYTVQNVSFAMVSPPVLNKNFTVNPPDMLKTEMGQMEVTQELFQEMMGWNASKFQSDPKNPVETVTWYDCISFCNKLSKLLGFEECYRMDSIKRENKHIAKAKVRWDESKNGFRLPYTKEWEFFAEAGTNNKWSGTNDVDKLNQYAWYAHHSGYRPHPVGEKLPNEWGLYDMSGNVWEWCWDSYDPAKSKERGVRGGCFRSNSDSCRVANRLRNDAGKWYDHIGFRLYRSLG